MWFQLLIALLGIVKVVTLYLAKRQDIEAEQAKALMKGYEDALDKINKARVARAAIVNGGGVSVGEDPNNRDNHPNGGSV